MGKHTILHDSVAKVCLMSAGALWGKHTILHNACMQYCLMGCFVCNDCVLCGASMLKVSSKVLAASTCDSPCGRCSAM